eukprot:CAMPEP_0198218928 /NCGR_PEP_ID=MMETSP1445-20131203/71877_1 /TAXON_ID=36898 /ORGANISM="Pyramimonas sp., Strain CCMP2087" /LENGTH=49 /DNA_ID= /DNA_START= /DNA_END= /DNA_ORIENTATION=
MTGLEEQGNPRDHHIMLLGVLQFAGVLAGADIDKQKLLRTPWGSDDIFA